MDIPVIQVDAFTRRPLSGNPAAVCLPDHWPDDRLLQRIANENGVSETAFARPEGDAWRLRWFTPTTEVPLCGHGTLATAHVLFERTDAQHLVFRTRSGELTVHRDGDAYRMDFPSLLPQPCSAPAQIAGALGIVPVLCMVGHRTHLALLARQSDVARLDPDLRAVAALPMPYLIATAPGDDCDFVSRFFAPAVGVPEDPVTGSAHCMLAPFWANRLGKNRLHARQISKRGGELLCEVVGGRVHLTGHAVTVLNGILHLPDPETPAAATPARAAPVPA